MDNAKFILVSAGVRYWEDATVNGAEDKDGTLIPFRSGDNWLPIIDVDTGTIVGWPAGVTAEIHYKVCDAGTYTLADAEYKKIGAFGGYYVPEILCPKDNGYGDYIILAVDEWGRIDGWFGRERVLDAFKESQKEGEE